METRDKILEIIKAKGPVLPFQIGKEIGTNILMASAHLAELSASGKVKVSRIKVGGSPLYYLPGQEAMLQKFTANMNDKEKMAYDMLNEKKILRDSELEPVIRVALREIKDFAFPLTVNFNDRKEIFWKWHMMKDSEAEPLIKLQLNILDEKKPEKIEEKPEPKPVEKEIEPKAAEKQKKLETKTEEREKAKKQKSKDDDFVNELNKFFSKNEIKVISSEIIKKNSEIDFILQIPSVVGNLQYYCKAKSKKRISDSDLSNAYVKGQSKRLPILVLSSGELTNKAEEILLKELNTLTFKQI